MLDLQRDALVGAGVDAEHLYEDHASGKRDDRPGLEACLMALRKGDTLAAWKLERLGRDLRHLVNLVHNLTGHGVGLKALASQGANPDTTTANGRLVFGIFAALAEFERELIVERTRAGLASARARGRNGRRPFKMTPAKLRLAQAAMGQPRHQGRRAVRRVGRQWIEPDWLQLPLPLLPKGGLGFGLGQSRPAASIAGTPLAQGYLPGRRLSRSRQPGTRQWSSTTIA